MAETALVLILFLVLAFGMIDLGVMVSRAQSLSQAARCAARAAIVRGEFADRLGALGPTAISGVASDSNAIADAARPHLAIMNPGDVALSATWIDGNNEIDSRVRVTLSADFTPMMTFIFGSPTWTLSGTSEMTIAH
jgi:Flp pilus assembly protein TadG